MNRRTLFRVRKRGEKEWMRDDARALGGIESHFDEVRRIGRAESIEFRKPIVHKKIVRLQKAAIVGLLAPDFIIEKHQQGSSQVGGNLRGKVRENSGILRKIV